MNINNTISLVLLVLTIFNSHSQSRKIVKCDCSFDPSEIEANNIWCGKLIVPESRDEKDSRMLEIAFTVINPANPAPDPVVVLPGGPGLAPLGGPFVAKIKSWIPQDRTLVVFDPRGTGQSGPTMCPDLNDTWGTIAAMDLNIDEQRLVRLGLDMACRDKLLRDGIDLNAYNSISVAHNANELMTSLGYEKYNLLGGSYGVPMSVMIMNLYPDKVRSASLLSGPYLDLNDIVRYDVPNFSKNLQHIFDYCKNDPECFKSYPNLEKDFYTVHENLKDEPLVLTVDSNEFRSPKFTLNSQDYIRIMYSLQTRESRIRYYPRFIQAFRDKEMGVIKNLVEWEFGGINSTSSRMGILVHCFDSYSESSYSNWKNEAASYHQALSEITYYLQPCEYWTDQATPDDLRAPFKSEVSTLLISGELDPMNPPEASESFLTWFKNAQHVTIPGMGHMPPSGRENACWTELIEGFINNPKKKIEIDCLSKIPDFKFSLKLPSWATRD